ncbi:MAG: OmpA family protein, partial [Silicimonas sp.]|nr:OmpA family protein [Silicimonas sp.]
MSLALPVPVIAQDQGQGDALGVVKQLARDLNLEMCGDDAEPLCVTEEGALLTDQPDLAASLAACTEAILPCATEDGFVLVEPDSDLALRAMAAAQDMESAEAEAEGEGAMSEGSAEQSADVETVEADSEEAASEGEETVSTIEEDTTAETVTPPAEDDTAATEDAPVTAEAETEAAETEASTAETETAEAPAEEAMETEENVAEAVEESTPLEQADTTEAEATEDVAADAAEDTATTEQAEVQEADVEETVIAEEAPAAAAASAEAETTAEVETEEVTEDTARSSAEDFETAVTGDTTAAATAPGDNDGLSNFEKALLIGLGAVAVGSILDNGDEVVSNSGDRVVLQDNQGNLRVLKNDDALLRQPGSQVQTETFGDGSTRTTVTREDGTKIVTIRDANGRVLRRIREFADGSRVVLFDDTEVAEPVDIASLPEAREQAIVVDTSDEDALRRALTEAQARDVGRTFSLNQVRQIRKVRELAPELDLDAVTFATGSAAIQPSQAEELTSLGRAMSAIISERPGEVFLIEGHTDAVGSATYNLALSDRRAE